jgi:type I restriction-modification system DNA methylase subunit
LDCLKSGGLLVFVVTDNLFRGSYPEIEEAILNKAELLDAYLLPDKTFPTTKIATSLIVLRKK